MSLDKISKKNYMLQMFEPNSLTVIIYITLLLDCNLKLFIWRPQWCITNKYIYNVSHNNQKQCHQSLLFWLSKAFYAPCCTLTLVHLRLAVGFLRMDYIFGYRHRNRANWALSIYITQSQHLPTCPWHAPGGQRIFDQHQSPRRIDLRFNTKKTKGACKWNTC
jgi:hypothetical protein